MFFPVGLADYIAKACDLPSLYIGEYKGLEINYIWCMSRQPALEFADYSTIVASSNKWIRGLNYGIRQRDISHLVDLSDSEDGVVKLFRLHQNFREAANVFDGYSLQGAFFARNRYMPFYISNPDLSKAPESMHLEKAFEEIRTVIHEKSRQNINVVSQAFQLRESESIFPYSLGYACLFGLSGLFEMVDAPHDLEYILEVVIDRNSFIFAKTQRWFRGIKLYMRQAKSPILDLTPSAINWDEMLTTSQGIALRSYLRLFQKAGIKVAEIKDPTKSEENSPLWNALRPLIEQLDQAE
jgi:hypothetical protein